MDYKVGDRVKVIANYDQHGVPIGTYGTIRQILPETARFPISLRGISSHFKEDEIRWALRGEENLAI